MSVPFTLFYYYQLAISAPLNTSIWKSVFFFFLSQQSDKINLITNNYRSKKSCLSLCKWKTQTLPLSCKERSMQCGLTGPGKMKWKSTRTTERVLAPILELSTLVFWVLVARQTDQWKMTETTPRKQNPGWFITMLHWKQRLDRVNLYLYFPNYLKSVFL